MKTVLLDTDYVIHFLRGREEVRDVIIDLWQQNLAFLSLMSVYELYAGMRPGEEEATDSFINACRIEPITLEIVKKAGIYRYKYQKQGITLSVIDCLIAEMARLNNHLLATNNQRHYPENNFLSSHAH